MDKLRIIKEFDIDTRIRLGIVRRLNIPERIAKLFVSLKPPKETTFDEGSFKYTRCDVIVGNYTITYMQYRYKASDNLLMDWTVNSRRQLHFYIGCDNRW
jgi:hypothetical protein